MQRATVKYTTLTSRKSKATRIKVIGHARIISFSSATPTVQVNVSQEAASCFRDSYVIGQANLPVFSANSLKTTIHLQVLIKKVPNSE